MKSTIHSLQVLSSLQNYSIRHSATQNSKDSTVVFSLAQGVGKGGGSTGVLASQWLHHSPHLTILVSEAILSAENSGKPLLDRGLRPEHCWGSSQRSPRPRSWWEGRVLLLSPREPHPPLSIGLRSSDLGLPMKNSRHAPGFALRCDLRFGTMSCRRFAMDFKSSCVRSNRISL